MKQKDIAIIVAVAVFSGIISFVLSGFLFASPEKRSQEVEQIDAISSDFPKPSDKYFNSESVNPAQPVEIGTSNNPNPFTGQ
jgi:hypothetical protein